MNNFFLRCLFLFSTCAHHQEKWLYQCDTWYMSLCVDDRLVCRSEWNSDLHTRRSSTQSDIYQVLQWYNQFSWWWAHGCPKHVENRNKHLRKKLCIKFVYLQRSMPMAGFEPIILASVWPQTNTLESAATRISYNAFFIGIQYVQWYNGDIQFVRWK